MECSKITLLFWKPWMMALICSTLLSYIFYIKRSKLKINLWCRMGERVTSLKWISYSRLKLFSYSRPVQFFNNIISKTFSDRILAKSCRRNVGWFTRADGDTSTNAAKYAPKEMFSMSTKLRCSHIVTISTENPAFSFTFL